MTACLCGHSERCHYLSGACSHCPDCFQFEAFDGPEAVCVGCQPKSPEEPKPLPMPEFELVPGGEVTASERWERRKDLE